ncbi:unnamed protein product [Somion occarium]|uniref:MYND-type domain-containing protein n=1 Tax=Somion occarium TaxID=3059160 RepID=A0ABP1CRT7_9APHY
MHLVTPSTLRVYIHNICDSGIGPCSEQLRVAYIRMQVENCSEPNFPPREPPAIEGQYPLAASCVKCKREETARRDLQRCSKCKVTRYCGIQCQAED